MRILYLYICGRSVVTPRCDEYKCYLKWWINVISVVKKRDETIGERTGWNWNWQPQTLEWFRKPRTEATTGVSGDGDSGQRPSRTELLPLTGMQQSTDVAEEEAWTSNTQRQESTFPKWTFAVPIIFPYLKIEAALFVMAIYTDCTWIVLNREETSLAGYLIGTGADQN